MWIAFFREYDDYKLSRSQQSFFLHARFSEFFWKMFIIAMNIDKTICCENMLITCFTFCLDVRCDLRNAIQIFSCRNFLWRFVLVILLDHLIVSVSDCLVSIQRVTHAHSRHVEWRMPVLDVSSDVCSFSTCRATYVPLMRRFRRSHFIKLRAIYYLRTIQKRLR